MVDKPFGIYFDELELLSNIKNISTVNGNPIIEKPVEKRWWRSKWVPNKNIAGEHWYIWDTQTKFTD